MFGFTDTSGWLNAVYSGCPVYLLDEAIPPFVGPMMSIVAHCLEHVLGARSALMTCLQTVVAVAHPGAYDGRYAVRLLL